MFAYAGMRGRKHTLESKAKMSAARIGEKHSAEWNQNISKGHIGKIQKPHTDEHKRKISLKSTGRKHTEETLAKMRIVQSGKIINAEQRIKTGIANSKAVARICPITGEAKEYRSMTEAYNLDGFGQGGISSVCLGKRIKYKGYHWKFISKVNL